MAKINKVLNSVMDYFNDREVSKFYTLVGSSLISLVLVQIMMFSADSSIIVAIQTAVTTIFNLIVNLFFEILPDAKNVFGQLLSVENIPSILFLGALSNMVSTLFQAFKMMLRPRIVRNAPILANKLSSLTPSVPEMFTIPTITK